MATDFITNVTATKGGFKPSAVDMPLDIRTRIDSIDDVQLIPTPYIGMVFYVKENGKRYEVLSLKDKKVGLTTLKNAVVDEYRELIVSYNDLADKPEIPSIEGLASEEYVQEQIAAIEHPTVDLEPYATKEEVEVKVDKEEGKSLVDDTEIARLADVHNYDDSEIRQIIGEKANASDLFSKDYNELKNKPEIPSIEGLASETFVQEQIAAIPEVDLEPYATKEEVEQSLDGKVDKVEGKSLIDNTEMTRLASVFNANYQFAINMIEYGAEPFVEYSGEFPNITVTFNIPVCYPSKPVIEGKMWYGWIPYDETGVAGFSTVEEIHEEMDMNVIQFGLDNGSLIEADPEVREEPITLDAVPEAAWLCIVLPLDSELKGYVDDGLGSMIPFTEMDTSTGLSVDDLTITNPINSVKYRVSGLYVTSPTNYIIYIKEN